MGGKYIFDSLDTALYKKDLRAKDYIPKHGMVVLEYVDMDLILRLIIHSPNYKRSESVFAWSLYKFDESSQKHELESVEECLFDNDILPTKKSVGIIIYQKLTNVK